MTTHAQRIDECARRQWLIVFAGAGLLGQIGCISAGALQDAPDAKRLAFILIVTAAFFLATARVKFEYHGTTLRRRVRSKKAQEDDPLLPADDWPRRGEFYYLSGISLTFAVGGVIVWNSLCALLNG